MILHSQDVPTNPYFYSGPIQDPSYFFGRQELLRSVFERLDKGACTSLIGERLSGKTSLLHYLMTDAVQRAFSCEAKYLFVYMNPKGDIQSPASFYRALMKELAKRVPSSVPDADKEVKERHVRSILSNLSPRRLVLLLDDFETIAYSANFDLDFLRFQRGLAVEGWITFITATTKDLFQCCPKDMVASGFPNIFVPQNLGAWTEPEFDHFLAETSQRSGAPIQAYKSEICRLAGHTPFYVQMACSLYFETWRERGKITSQDQANIEQRFATEAESYFATVWKTCLEPDEKATLIALAHGKEQTGSAILRRLMDKGYLKGGQLFSSAFADFVLRMEAEGETAPA